LDSKALTKIQSVMLITIIVVAAVAGSAAYVLWSGPGQPTENIKIGVCADLDMAAGKYVWQGAILAAEQVNAEGGVLGRNITIVAEDDNNGADTTVATEALTRLITVDQAEFILTPQALLPIVYQDISAEHKKILFSLKSVLIELTQRVIDNYDKYKYFFRVMNPNVTMTADIYADTILTMRNYTGFNKIAFLVQDSKSLKDMESGMKPILQEHGFEVVYDAIVPLATTDFTSNLAVMEEKGAQILYPLFGGQASVSLVKEWCDRQSPFILWGNPGYAGDSNFWDLTQGKCENVTFNGWPVLAWYPQTSKTLATREAYIQRWGSPIPNSDAAAAYDVVRFILPDAIKRAGTTETEAVIKTLETTNVETSLAGHFRFTSSHDVMMGIPGQNGLNKDYPLACMFQWQNKTQVPVYPEEIMKETGSTYRSPPWSGPWSSTKTP
jgi:branched-chain amino acid transport system substrate-binding protein